MRVRCALGSWNVTALACMLGGLPTSTSPEVQRPSSLSGEWRIEFRLPGAGASATGIARGSLRWRDTLIAVRQNGAPSSPMSALVGTYAIDFRPIRANPIGIQIRGQVSARTQLHALVGEGYDRGEIELHGNVMGDSVSGQFLIVDGEARTRSGTFTMRRTRR